jgi:hypothetical protein
MSETTSATKLKGKDRYSGTSVQSYNSIPGTVLRRQAKFQQATGVATRVLQRAPIGYAGGIKLYEYAMGRPNFVPDPTGLVGEVPLAFISQNAWSQVADNIEESFQARSFGAHVHGWPHLRAAEYVRPLFYPFTGTSILNNSHEIMAMRY